MLIWTTQPLHVATKIIEGNTYTRNMEEGHKFFHAYHWFADHCKMQSWPIWCWITPPTEDELEKIINERGESVVVMSLNIPNNMRIIFSNFYAWHYALFYNYLDTEENMFSFDHKYQIDHPNKLKTLAENQEHIKEEVLKSWKRMFDLQWCKNELSSDIVQVAIDKIHPMWLETAREVKKVQDGLDFRLLKSVEPII